MTKLHEMPNLPAVLLHFITTTSTPKVLHDAMVALAVFRTPGRPVTVGTREACSLMCLTEGQVRGCLTRMERRLNHPTNRPLWQET